MHVKQKIFKAVKNAAMGHTDKVEDFAEKLGEEMRQDGLVITADPRPDSGKLIVGTGEAWERFSYCNLHEIVMEGCSTAGNSALQAQLNDRFSPVWQAMWNLVAESSRSEKAA